MFGLLRMSTVLPDDVLERIISFFYNYTSIKFPNMPSFDTNTLYSLSLVNKMFYSTVKSPEIWKEYYRSFGTYWEIAPNARHVGMQTYHRCSVGPYPGWKFIHDEIPSSVCVCKNINHYDKHVRTNKNVRWKDLNRHCAKLKYENIIKNIGEWDRKDQQNLEWMLERRVEINRRISHIEQKKKINQMAYTVFEKYISPKRKLTILEKLPLSSS